jgi:hypothetical protein
MPSMPCKPWRIVSDGIQKIADVLPEPVRLLPDYKNALPLGKDCALLTGRGPTNISPSRVSFSRITPPRQRYHGFIVFLNGP